MPGLVFAQTQASNFEILPSLTWVVFAVFAVATIWIVSSICGTIKRVASTRLEVGLKHALVERGMTVDEIERVIRVHRDDDGDAVDLPCACEAVVEYEGDWLPALVLQVGDGRYYIHYIGNDMDGNEWVGEDRIRFPAGSELPALVAQRLRTDRNGMPGKNPIEAEV